MQRLRYDPLRGEKARRSNDTAGTSFMIMMVFVLVVVGIVMTAVIVSVISPKASIQTATSLAASTLATSSSSSKAASTSTTASLSSSSSTLVAATSLAGGLLATFQSTTTSATTTAALATSTSSTSSTDATSTTSTKAATTSTAAASTDAAMTSSTSSTFASAQTTAAAAGILTSFTSTQSDLTTSTSSTTAAKTATSSTSSVAATSLASTSLTSTATAGATTGPSSGLDIWVDSVDGSDSNSGLSPAHPVKTLAPRALSLVSTLGYNAYCLVHLAAGNYSVPDNTAFDGTTHGTRTGPVVIRGATGPTLMSGGMVMTPPTIDTSVGLYRFSSSPNPPNFGQGESSFFTGMTLVVTAGMFPGATFTVAASRKPTIDNIYLAYGANTVGGIPQLFPGDTFDIVGPSPSVVSGAVDGATWLSNNAYQHRWESVVINAMQGGSGLLSWSGLAWGFNDVWLGDIAYSGDTIAMQLSVSSCSLTSGYTTGVSDNRGIRFGLNPSVYSMLTAAEDNIQGLLVVQGTSTLNLGNCGLRSLDIEMLSSTSSTTLSDSSLLANSVQTVVAGTMTHNSVAGMSRQDIASTAYPTAVVSGPTAKMLVNVWYTQAPDLCTSGCPVAAVFTSASGFFNGTSVVLDLGTASARGLLVGETSTLVMAAGTIITDSGQDQEIIRVNGTAILSTTTATAAGGGFLTQYAGSTTMTGCSVTSTEAFPIVSCLGGSVSVSGSTLDGGTLLADIVYMPSACSFSSSSTTTIQNVATAFACVHVLHPSAAATLASTAFSPNQGYCLYVHNGTATVSASSFTGGASQSSIRQDGGTLSVTSSTLTADSAHSGFHGTGGTATFSGCSVDMLSFSNHAVLLDGPNTLTMATTSLANVPANFACLNINSSSASASLLGCTLSPLRGYGTNVISGAVTVYNCTLTVGTNNTGFQLTAGTLLVNSTTATAQSDGRSMNMACSGGTLTVVGSTFDALNLTNINVQIACTANIASSTIKNVGTSTPAFKILSGTVSVTSGSLISPGVGTTINQAAGTLTFSSSTAIAGTGSVTPVISISGTLIAVSSTFTQAFGTAVTFISLTSGSTANFTSCTVDGSSIATTVITGTACTIGATGTTFQNAASSSTLLLAQTSAAVTTSGCTFLPAAGFGIRLTGTATWTSTSDLFVGGSSQTAVTIGSGTTATVGSGTFNATAAITTITQTGGFSQWTNCLVDGNLFDQYVVVVSGGNMSIVGGTYKNTGSTHYVVRVIGSGVSLYASGGVIFSGGGSGAFALVQFTTSAYGNFYNASLGTTPGDGIRFQSSSTGDVAYLTSPSGQSVAGNGVILAACPATVNEKTATNTALSATTSQTKINTLSRTFAQVDAAGTITSTTCSMTAN